MPVLHRAIDIYPGRLYYYWFWMICSRESHWSDCSWIVLKLNNSSDTLFIFLMLTIINYLIFAVASKFIFVCCCQQSSVPIISTTSVFTWSPTHFHQSKFILGKATCTKTWDGSDTTVRKCQGNKSGQDYNSTQDDSTRGYNIILCKWDVLIIKVKEGNKMEHW